MPCVLITILNDQSVETIEYFSVNLETADPDVSLRNESTTVTILDDNDGTVLFIWSTSTAEIST